MFLYLLHSQGFMGYRKTKKASLSFPENLIWTKRKFHFWGALLLTILLFCPSFLRITSTSLRAFPPLAFLASQLCKLCSFLDWSFSHLQHPWIWFISRLIPFGFWELNFATFYLSYPLFFASGNTLPNAAIKSFSSLLKLVVRLNLEPTILSHNFQQGIKCTYK